MSEGKDWGAEVVVDHVVNRLVPPTAPLMMFTQEAMVTA